MAKGASAQLRAKKKKSKRGRPRGVAENPLSRYRSIPPEDEIQKMLRLRGQGLTIPQIAKRFGRSYQRTWEILHTSKLQHPDDRMSTERERENFKK